MFDDAATALGLLNYFLRAVHCGALPSGEIPGLTGLTLEELSMASFAEIFKGREKPAAGTGRLKTKGVRL
ncbi:MAG TPA: hypothetical protein VN841_10035 [Bryobacteraceae bacterium]|nr:hypothetical protein [Bryobacteraceae bacterium]